LRSTGEKAGLKRGGLDRVAGSGNLAKKEASGERVTVNAGSTGLKGSARGSGGSSAIGKISKKNGCRGKIDYRWQKSAPNRPL